MRRSSARRCRAWIATTLLVVMLPFATVSCFGSFRLTGKIYRFNREISSDKWIRWITFLVLVVVPAYPIGLLIDGVFANSIEFWSGSNPFAAEPGTTRTAYGPHGEAVTARWLEDGRVRLEVVEASGAIHTLLLVEEADAVAAYDPSGRRVARLVDLSSTPRVLRD
jgi:hypothetical protein